MSIAFVFPGQGSQSPGMGLDWAAPSLGEPDLYGWASACLGWDVATMLRDATAEQLRRTALAQPAIFCVSVAALRALERAGVRPRYVAGHSLGELSALVAADACSFEAALALVARRAELMQAAADRRPGSMSAVLGLSIEGVELAVSQAAQGDVLAIANDNAPGNVVVSGDRTALDRLAKTASDLGAKRVLALNVGGAFHSPLMEDAAQALRPFLMAAPISDLRVPLITNASASPTTDATEVRGQLASQLTGPVRWTESVRRLAALGVDTFVEVGPGSVLAGLIRRIVPGGRVLNVSDAAGVRDAVELLGAGDNELPAGGDQGEVVLLPERFAVSPGHGRYYPTEVARTGPEGPYVERGDLVGEVRNGNARIPVHSPFRGQVSTRLAWEGDVVTPGQLLLSLRPF